MIATNLFVFENPDDLAQHTASLIVERLRNAIETRGRGIIALSGGKTPLKTYQLLAAPPYAEAVDWSMVYVFVGDERFVPSDDPRSNYAMIRESLLRGVTYKPNYVFPVPTEMNTASAAAMAYEATLRQAVPDGRIDVNLLGLGTDGHTASLFPNSASLQEKDRWVVSTPAGTTPPLVDRITLTYPILNAARSTIFLVSGKEKAGVLMAVRSDACDPLRFPAAGVKPIDGEVVWHVDRDAAGESDR